MTLGIPEWWLGLREGGGQEQDGCRDAERGKAEGQTEGERLIETREIQYLLNEKDEFQ